MEVNLLVLLLAVGAIGLLRFRMRYDRVLSWLMLIASVVLVYSYSLNAFDGISEGFQYLWSKTKFGDLFISFHPEVYWNKLIIPILLLLVLSIMNNNVFHYEERRGIFNSLLIFNAVSLCLLITSENYVQILTMIFVSDILGYTLLKDGDSSHRYAIYNFFADMCLFAVFASVCGRLQSLDVRQLLNYNQVGRHKDFVSLAVALAIFIKIGCVPFHSYLLDLTNARFHRMNVINLLFSPLCGLILLIKLNNILTMSDIFVPVYLGLGYLSFVVGIYGFVVKDNILCKVVYLNLSLFSILMLMLQSTGFVWQNIFSCYYFIIYLLNLMLFKIYLYQNREECVSNMLNSSSINSIALKTILLQITMVVNIGIMLMHVYVKNTSNNTIFYLFILLICALSIVLNHIYKSRNSNCLDYKKENNKSLISFAVNTVVLIMAIVYFNAYHWKNVIYIFIFLCLVNVPIWSKFEKLYDKKSLQTEDYCRYLFNYMFFVPIKHISKTLWIMVDFVISEKIITSAIEAINRQSITLFFKLNPKKGFAGIIFIIIGIAIFVISFVKERW